MNDVVLDINMYSFAMKFKVFDKTQSTLVVGEQMVGRDGGLTKVGEKPSMPNTLLGGRGGKKILCLSGHYNRSCLL